MKKYYLSHYKEDHYAYSLLKASLIQKLIRRGMIGESLFMADLYIKENQSKGLKRRLQIIAAEDIGFGWNDGTLFVESEPDLLKVTSALCQANKNREPHHFLDNGLAQIDLKDRGREIVLEVNSLRKIIHISETWGKDKTKANLNAMKDAFKKLVEYSAYPELVSQLADNYLDIKRAKIHGAECILAYLILVAIRKTTPSNWSPDLTKLDIIPFDEMFDFALDAHTLMGRELNRGWEFWLENGSVVNPLVTYPELYDSHGNLKYVLK